MNRFTSLAPAIRAAASCFSITLRGAALGAALLLSATLNGCWSDGPIAAEEEDEFEVVFGSTAPGGGDLVTDYDFGVPKLVEFNTELGGFTVDSGIDPGFVSLDGVEAVEGIHPLPDGLTIGIRITAIDPGVQITFGEAVLAAEGDSTELGETPIHLHPQWQLIYPSGEVPPPDFVSFVLTAPGYGESEAYTATIVVADEE